LIVAGAKLEKEEMWVKNKQKQAGTYGHKTTFFIWHQTAFFINKKLKKTI